MRSIKMMILIVSCFAIALLIIPEFITGIMLIKQGDIGFLPTNYMNDIIAIKKFPPAFSVSSLSQATAVFSLIIYSFVVSAAIKHNFIISCKKNKLIIRQIVYFIILLILILMFIAHYYEEINDLFIKENSQYYSDLIKICSEMTLLFSCSCVFIYKLKKMNQ
jgi:hypothetical protein